MGFCTPPSPPPPPCPLVSEETAGGLALERIGATMGPVDETTDAGGLAEHPPEASTDKAEDENSEGKEEDRRGGSREEDIPGAW